MTTLYLDRRDLTLRLEGETLALYLAGRREATLPLHIIERIVMLTSVHVDTGALARLADRGIAVVLFGGRLGHKCANLGIAGPGDASRRLGQYRAWHDDAWRQRFSRRLVLAKVQGHSRLITRARQERPDLHHPLTAVAEQLAAARTRLRNEPDLDLPSLRGIEGAAAAAAFQGLIALLPPTLGFQGRRRRPPPDPVNATLSLGYSLLHREAVGACQSAGLDPLIGFFHDLSFGRESLACDLVEPLRPRVDHWVWTQFRTRALTAKHFAHEGAACLLAKTGRSHFFRAWEPFVRPVRRWLRRCTNRLAGQLAAHPQLPASESSP